MTGRSCRACYLWALTPTNRDIELQRRPQPPTVLCPSHARQQRHLLDRITEDVTE